MSARSRGATPGRAGTPQRQGDGPAPRRPEAFRSAARPKPAADVRRRGLDAEIAEPRCTDVKALLVFLLFNYGLLTQVWRGHRQGDLRRLTRGLDFRGRLCGVDVGTPGEFLHWCSLDGRVRWDAPICVRDCPVGGESLLCPQPPEPVEESEEALCSRGAPTHNGTRQCASPDEAASGMLLTRVTRQRLEWRRAEATRRVQNVCVPAELRLQVLLDRLLGAENDVSSLALQAAAKLAALAEAPLLMLGLLVAAVASGVLWVLLLRASLRLFMWTLLVLSSLAVAALGAALLMVAKLQLPSPVSDLDSQPGLRKALGVLGLVVGMWALPRFYCANAKKMGLAVYTVREGCLIVFSTPLLALLPLLELALRVGLILAAGGGAALLFSAAEVHLAKVSIFGELVAGVPRSFELTAQLVTGLLYVGFALVWYQELISAISTFVVSRTAVLSYFGSACLGVPSTSSALLSHLGSFALGAANSACLLIPRMLGLAREFNHRAYVDMAITAAPLLESSCSASTLLAGSGFVLAARGILLRAVLLVGNVAFSAGCGLAANAFLVAAQAGAVEDGQVFALARTILAVIDPGVPGGLPEAITAELEALGSPVTAGAAVAVVAFLVVQSFAAVIDRVADAVLYCSLWDRQAGTEVEQVPSRFRNVIDTQAFIDPISHEIMADPVVAADGHSYERSSITRWFQQSSRSPMTNADLDNCNLVPNIALRQQIEGWTQSSLLQR